MSDEAITWIHLSDFHAGQRGGAVWNQVDVELRESVEQMAAQLGRPDVVLFTGDLANRGAEDEYAQVDLLLDRLGAWLGGEVPVFAVPGNHDVVRPGKADAWRYSGLLRYDDHPEIAQALWEEHLPLLEPLFPHYVRWAEARVLGSLRKAGWDPYRSLRVPGDLSVEVTKGSMRLGLVGLNTAWAHLKDVEGGLPLPVEQLQAALPPRPGGLPLDWFRDVPDALLLTHHPRRWLSSRGQATYHESVYAKGRFAAALYGHVHAGGSEVVSISGTEPRAFYQAQSIFGLEHYGTKNEDRSIGYAWGRITARGEVRVWPLTRVERKDGSWAFDRDTGFAAGGVRLRASREGGRGSAGDAAAPGAGDRPEASPPSAWFQAELARYRDKAKAQHETIPLAGFDTRVRVPIRLDELYVPLDAYPDLRGAGPWSFGDADEAEMHLFGRGRGHADHVDLAGSFGCAQRYGQRRGLVILGDPGSGKTTQLRRMMLAVLQEGPRVLGLPDDVVPVFLPLRAFESPQQTLEAFVAERLAELELPDCAGFVHALVHEHGKVLYLLDGLDEVASDDRRVEVVQWIERVRRAHTQAWFAVTCRYAGYRGKVRLSEQWLELHLRSLTPERSEQFIRNWFRIVEGALATDPELGRRKAHEGAESLLVAMQAPGFRNQRVAMLTRNPLLLTAICLVHRDRGTLPQRRVELYDECVKVMLELWRESKALKASLPAREAQLVLQPVARWLHEVEGRRQAPLGELLPVVERALAAEGKSGLVGGAAAFLQSIRDESGLLTGWGGDRFGFMHLGFQEYLAARDLRRRGFDDPEVLRELAGHFGEAWWQEVILLMLGLEDPPIFERFMHVLVERPELPQWLGSEMMAFCLDEARGKSARPFVAALDGAEGERLQALVGVLERFEGIEVPAAVVERAKGMRRVEVAEPRVRVDARTGVTLVWIDGGTFVMGSPEGEAGREVYPREYLQALKDRFGFKGHPESPQHPVTLAGFWLAKTPITNAQYRRFLEDRSRSAEVKEPEHWGDRQYNQDDQPVVGVSWHEAKAYCAWAGLVLPTEAQWEYACRAGTTTPYWSGDGEEDLARVGWYGGNSEMRLHAVAEKDANPWGLHDMHGNVWEWCCDALVPYATSVRAGDGLRREPVGDALRVVRGGSWRLGARYARAACRYGSPPASRDQLLGFRPAQVIP